MTYRRNSLSFLFSLIFGFLFGQENLSPSFDFKSLTNESSAKVCKVPLSFGVENAGQIDKLTNIGSANELNVDNNGGIIYFNSITYVITKNEQAKELYSPIKSEALHRKRFEQSLGINQDSIIEPDGLPEQIKLWNKRLKYFVEKLKQLKDEEKKKEGYEILKQYKENLDTASCLIDDYGDQIIVKEDSNGTKEFLFDLEKIQNDPNYFFIGEVVEGFSVAKKFNKYGYISLLSDYNNIPFRYDFCFPFSNGFGVTYDDYYYYVIDRSGSEILKYPSNSIASIQVINANSFLIEGVTQSNSTEKFIVNQKGEILSDKYHNIIPIEGTSNYFKASLWYKQVKYPILPSAQSKKDRGGSTSKYLYAKSNYLIDKHGKVIFPYLMECSTLSEKCLIDDPDCWYVEIQSIVADSTSDKLLLLCSIIHEGYVSEKDRKGNITKKIVPNSIQKDRSYILEYFDSKLGVECYDINVSVKNEEYIIRGWDSLFPINSINTEGVIGNKTLLGVNVFFSAVNIMEINDASMQYEYYRYTLDSDLAFGRRMLFNTEQKRFIGEYYSKIEGYFPDKKLIHVSKSVIHKKEQKEAYGIMNFDGLYIIPPIFKKVTFDHNTERFQIEGFNGISYLIDIQGNCLENCKEYNSITKEYFFLEKKGGASGRTHTFDFIQLNRGQKIQKTSN